MNGIPKPLPKVQSLIENLTAARQALGDCLEQAQEECSHPIVLERRDRGVTRLCPACGREEQTPHFHGFWFVALQDTPSRLIVPAGPDFYSHRLPESRRWVNGEKEDRR